MAIRSQWVLSCLQRLSVVSGWQSLLALRQGFQRSKQVRACQHILAAGSRSLVRVVIKSCHGFGRQEKTNITLKFVAGN
ncbi:hypothetical protein Peur_048183 [Populus x canadensis]